MSNQKAVIFLESLEDVELFNNHRHRIGIGDIRIISLSIEVGLALERLGFDYVNIWEYIETSDLRDIPETAAKLAGEWFMGIIPDKEAHFEEKALYAEFENFFSYALVCSSVIKKSIDRYNPEIILLFPILGKGFIYKTNRKYYRCIFNAMLHYHVKRRKIKKRYAVSTLQYQSYYWWQAQHADNIRTYLYRCKTRFFQSLKDKMDHFKNPPRPPQKIKIPPPAKPRVLFLGWNFDLERQMSLEDFLDHETREYETVHLYLGEPRNEGVYSDSSVLPIADFSNAKSKRFATQWRIRVKKKAFSFFCKKYSGKYPEIFSNPWMRSPFDLVYFDNLDRIACQKAVCENILDQLHPTAICLSDADAGFPCIMRLLAKQKKFPTISFNHGAYNSIMPSDYFTADYITAWGEGTKEAIVKGGVDPERIHVIGNQVWQDIVSSMHPCASKEKQPLVVTASYGLPQNRMRYQRPKVPRRKQILVITSGFEHVGLQPVINMMEYQRSIRTIMQLTKIIPEVSLVVKSHPTPGFDWDYFYKGLAKSIGGDVTHIANEKAVGELAIESELVIVPNIISTSMFEVLLYEKPVVFLSNAVNETLSTLRTFYRVCEIGLVIKDLKDLDSQIKRLLTDVDFRTEIIAKGQKYLNLFCSMDGNANGKIRALISKVVKDQMVPSSRHTVSHARPFKTNCRSNSVNNPFPTVTAVLVNHDTDDDTEECIRRLRTSQNPRLNICLIDNGTRPSKFSQSEKQKNIDQYVVTPNHGFAAGCNIGLKWAMDHQSDFVWLVNPDLAVEPDTLPLLINAVESSSQIAFCGPKILYDTESPTIQFAGGLVRKDAAYWLPRCDFEADQGQYEKQEEVDWISGACMLINLKAVKDIGFMDESYFLYYEDVDWCLRVKKHGWKCLYLGNCKVRHKASQSTKNVRAYYYPKAHFLFLAKHYPHLLGAALQRYYHHSLQPHLAQRVWPAFLTDLKVYKDFLWQWMFLKKHNHHGS